MPKRPIGIFDSGLGGLTVMRHVIQSLPFEDVIYLADTARVPYGGRSAEAVRRFTLASCLKLASFDLKALVVACNTASACALEPLQEQLSVPVIGVIDPGVEAASRATKSGRIGILATPRTVSSHAYQGKLLAREAGFCVTAVACPLFVPLVEEQLFEHRAARLLCEDYLAPIRESSVDTLLLGCTHYPLLRSLIQELLGAVTIVDTAAACTEALKDELERKRLREASGQGRYTFVVTDDTARFKERGELFLGQPIDAVSAVSIE